MAEKKKLREDSKRKHKAALESLLHRVNWRDLTFVGTELANVEVMRKDSFTFPALEDQLERGALSHLPHPLYLFAVSEPVYLRDCETILNVPVIVALNCSIPPPSLVCHDSVQSTDASTRALNPLGGRPLDMRTQQLAWVPYIPEKLLSQVSTTKQSIPVVTLKWEGRRSRTKNMTEEQIHYVEYLNPYIVLPQVCDALEKPEVRNVDFVLKIGDKNVDVVFDKDIDRLAEFIPDLIEKQSLPADSKEEIEKAIREAFKKARVVADEQWEELQSRLNGMSESDRKALREAKLYKFYPSHPNHDLRPYLSARVNRYYGNANVVLGGDPISHKNDEKPTEEVHGEPAAKRNKKEDA